MPKYDAIALILRGKWILKGSIPSSSGIHRFYWSALENQIPGGASFNRQEISKMMATGRHVYKEGRLTAAPNNKGINRPSVRGLQPLGLRSSRDGLIYIPAGYTIDKPAALAVMLHGAGGVAEHGLNILRSYADDHGLVLVAPASRLDTWDIIAGDSFDADVIFIDQALSTVFNSYAIDKTRIAVGGFSDGASYALSLGLGNGQLFTHIIAFSPGFYFTRQHTGKPLVFISHGVKDHVLPINPCSRRIVPDLKQQGYSLNYYEFDGEHEIPSHIATAAVDWFKA